LWYKPKRGRGRLVDCDLPHDTSALGVYSNDT